MFECRFTAIFTPAGAAPLRLCTAHVDALLEEPESEWELPCDRQEFVSGDWARVLPTGNATRSLAFEVLKQAPSVGQLEAYLTRHEIALAMHRKGTLLIRSGYHCGTPSVCIRWQAVLEELDCSLIVDSSDVTPYNPKQMILYGAALGRARYGFILTHPTPADLTATE